MQDSNSSFQQKKQSEISYDNLNELQQENQRLQLENAQLKSSLEKEEFLHKNLYKQWTELNARGLNKSRELERLKKQTSPGNFYRYSFYPLLLITIVFAYYLLSEWGKNSASLQTLTITTDTLIRDGIREQQKPNLPAENKELEKKDTIAARPLQPVVINEPTETQAQKTSPSERPGQYRVKTKTFFYNAPDERTRRNIFLLPYKDAYGIVTALNDKNDFIYVIYTNHRGRTSRGWIRKTDLDVVNQ